MPTVEQWILIALIVVLVIAYPILVTTRNKKENQRMQQQTNSLKKGDKVMLTSGVFGKIVDMEQEGDRKLITIETGTSKNRGYVTVDAYAVYQVITDAPAPAPQPEKAEAVETKPEEPAKEQPAEAKTEKPAPKPRAPRKPKQEK